MPIQFDEEKQDKKIRELLHTEEEDLMHDLANSQDLQYVDLTAISIAPDGLRLVDEARARAAKLAVFGMIGKKLEIALHTTADAEAVKIIGELKSRGYETRLHLASMASLEKAWNRYKDISFAYETKAGSLDISNTEIMTLLKEVKTTTDIKKLIEEVLGQKKSYRISRILEIMVAGAIATNASDIHIEPEELSVRLRYRLDGVLTDILHFDRETYLLILSRIKLLSGLKLNIKTNAQDGRFSVTIDDTEIEIRTSVLPGAYSESIVMRLLNPKSIQVPIESLGIEPKLFKILMREIDRPNGMVLTTGPTGSGKTTTLYSFLRKIYVPQIKIITIEDPIEYHLAGIVQTQTNAEKNYTFASGLRAVLRQDPDVIMVGEIRDAETAEMAINSALTGHLVFSTLHTNNAAGTFPRLIDLGVNAKVISSAVNVSLAQRLVRTLCKACKEKVKIEGKALEVMTLIMNTIDVEEYKLPLTEMWVAKGCSECHDIGYKGRIGIYEAILTDDKIEAVVRENPSEREIRAAAKGQGLLDMKQDGIVKVLQGVTSLDELQRVIDLVEF